MSNRQSPPNTEYLGVSRDASTSQRPLPRFDRSEQPLVVSPQGQSWLCVKIHLKTPYQDVKIHLKTPYYPQDVLSRHLHTLSRRIAKTPAYPIKTYGQDTCIPYQDVLPRHLHTLSRRITKTYARDTKKVVMEGEEANTNRCECGVHLRKIDRPRLGPLPIPQARCR